MAEAFDYSAVILDLDALRNIGHPCWEFLQPLDLPLINKLSEKFNNILFEGLCDHRSIGLEILGKYAGETLPLAHNPRDSLDRFNTINLNKELSGSLLRKEIIETLIHEMIHSYLMKKDMEDPPDNNHHGPNFDAEMKRCNSLTGLNITVKHEIPLGQWGFARRTAADIENAKRYMTRCTGDCKTMAPYFGFVWLKTSRDPKETDLMCMPTAVCAHEFEKYGPIDDPKGHFTEWECIERFNQFIRDNRIQIKTREMRSITNDYFTIAPSSYEPDAEIQNEWTPPAVPSKLYMNFDNDTKTFLCVRDLDLDMYTRYNDVMESYTICMICSTKIDENPIIILQHLRQCTGIEFPIENNESLPIFKIAREE